MNSRTELLVYTILIATAACLSFLLVRNVITARAARADYRQGKIYHVPEEPPKLPEPTPLAQAIKVFAENEIFGDLNELLPTPTKVIEPSPTPTIKPLCENWQVVTILGSRLVQIKLPDGKTDPYKVGDTIPKRADLRPNHKLLKIEKDRVAIIRLSDREWCYLYKGGGATRMEGPPPE